MTGFIHSNGWVYMLTCNNSLDCFVPRNDGQRVSSLRYRLPSLRACEAIQEKQPAKALQKLVTCNRRSGVYCNEWAVSLDCFVVPPRNDGTRYRNDGGRYNNDGGVYCNDGGTYPSLQYRLPSLRACEAIQKHSYIPRNDNTHVPVIAVPPTRHCEPAKQSIPPIRHCEEERRSNPETTKPSLINN